MNETQLRVLLMATEVEATPLVIQELQKWANLLKTVYDNPSEGNRLVVVEGLTLRGIPEAPVILSVSTVSQGCSKADRQPIPVSLTQLLTIHPERLEWSELSPGQGVSAELHILGGPGQITVECDQVQVTPQQFEKGETRVRVDVKPGHSGMVVLTSINLVSAVQKVEVPVFAQWKGDSQDNSLPRCALDEHKQSKSAPIHRWLTWGGVFVVLIVILFGFMITREISSRLKTYEELTDTVIPKQSDTHISQLFFPVTIDEWRSQQAQRSTRFTREGNHYWRYVPGGSFIIGDDTESNVLLPNYWIARYPITVGQYRLFMEAGGYENEQYWTHNGWIWKVSTVRTQPYNWNNEKFNNDNQPVVTVSWYEAMAYATWLNSELAKTLPEGYRIRLPNEAEWEVACGYGADQKWYDYPWGQDEPVNHLADFDDGSNADRPSSVGMHPEGASACGVQDMVGSVWEAMSSSYAGYPSQSAIIVDDFAISEQDVSWRGGSWYGNKINVRCMARFNIAPDYFDLNNGFRLVISQ